MANATPMIVLVITFLALLVALAGISAGAAGYSWWKTETPIEEEIGLWRTCTEKTNCYNREEILEFSDKNKEKDITLTLLLCGGLFAVLATWSALCLCCCKGSYSGWICGSVLVLNFSFIAAAANFGAVIYAEIEFKDTWNTSDHGWSAISAWIGAAMCFFAFVMGIVLTCLSPTNRRPTSYRHNLEGPYYNQGMQMNEQGYQQK
ncbi:uncharacterized protein LOC130642045 [Hydractinia symbiolongicarpus]|uniref:uncharacterized protein LOC130642045 n=1 Tax=Hydractinia symbiolongicarpus TaxID=13093 RepID=UPI0025519A35|nr:uncharacterized protein LOC130642045 [Hydractinia symbiolongicarpus]